MNMNDATALIALIVFLLLFVGAVYAVIDIIKKDDEYKRKLAAYEARQKALDAIQPQDWTNDVSMRDENFIMSPIPSPLYPTNPSLPVPLQATSKKQRQLNYPLGQNPNYGSKLDIY